MSGSDRLGRGLSALLGEHADGATEAVGDLPAPARLPVRAIAPNPFQPRREFQPAELAELATSIRVNGLLQAIVVRRSATGRTFELVAGERRLRAVRQLGWRDIPAQIRDVDDQTLLVHALVENIQREDLGPLEEATGYQVLRDRFGYSQQKIADAVGRSRSTVANMLRLLTLPPSVRRLLEEGTLSMGHGRALVAVEDPFRAAELARAAAAGRWSVRKTEAKVREVRRPTPRASVAEDPDDGAADPAIGVLEEGLCAHLEARVAIRWKGSGPGAIRIAFNGPRELERIFAVVTGREASEVVG